MMKIITNRPAISIFSGAKDKQFKKELTIGPILMEITNAAFLHKFWIIIDQRE
ncbi:MAG TPA: hypothetical protein VFX43_13685 [Chitinophagaceae bacterium]|nr:hypothetical protein [Chitinophagaceae bacterium]